LELHVADSATDPRSRRAAAEDVLSAVLQTVAQPVWVMDPDGLIRFANPAAIAALGYDTLDELLGRHSHETIHYRHPDGSPYPASECPMLLPRTTGERVARDLDWFLRRDGSMFPVSYVSVPLDMPEGRGAVVAFTDIEERRRAEEALREREARLAEEQAALRRVAALAAQGAGSEEVFAAVANEVARVLGLPFVEMSRFEPDGTATVIGAWSDGPHPFITGSSWPLDGAPISAEVLRTGRPARIDDFTHVPGTIAEAVRGSGMRSGAGAPILVEGVVWGVMVTGTSDPRRLAPDIEGRLGAFTELVATVVANTQARDDVHRLADEQAALRRVATLVAHGASPEEVFAAVAREVAEVLKLPLVEMCRYNADETATVIGATGEHPFQPGTTWSLDGPSLTSLVRRTGRPARIDEYAGVEGAIGAAARGAGVHAGVGAPVVVDGEIWGVVSAGGGERVPLPRDAETRLSAFTELVATAISNTQARADLHRLADEQAALRRVATLVAQGAESRVVFDAVCEETGRLLEAATVNLVHFTEDDINVTIAGWSLRAVHVPTGTRLPLDGAINALVRDTAAPGRFDSYENVPGRLAERLRDLGIHSEVGAPVLVEGRVWGALIAGSDEPRSLPAGAELRLAKFAELIATAVSNATTRSELIASRARIVEAADEQRRRVVRDLHDGAQQRLVYAIMTLQLAQSRRGVDPDVAGLIDESLRSARSGIEELRELARGIHPAILTDRGLGAAVESLADRAPLPVRVDVPDARYPASVESAAYFVAAEALTNVAKYARAGAAQVIASEIDGRLCLTVEDDGVGGARAYQGSGLSGLHDRVAALDGALSVRSPAGGGTRVRAEIPLR
jgi:PAS domain S-box-containing protein